MRIGILRRTLMVYVVIFVLWGLYRLLFRFPVFIEELLFKPFVFLPPILSVLAGEGRGKVWRSFGFSRAGLALAIYYGLTLGVVYLLAVRLGSLIFSGQTPVWNLLVSPGEFLEMMLISLFTAGWEQILFSGFLLLRFTDAIGDEWASASLVALLFTLLHLPILFLESGGTYLVMVIELALFFLVGFGNAVLMLRTRNILAPILSHSFWGIAVGLFL